jgi:hypothetical protein
MDAATFRGMLERNLETGSHEMYQDDAVLEFPQSGERFEGVENFEEWRSQYPAETKFEFGEVRGRDDLWVVELTVTYDDGPVYFGIGIHELREDKIARETIYTAEGFEAPEWRAQWRSGQK